MQRHCAPLSASLYAAWQRPPLGLRCRLPRCAVQGAAARVPSPLSPATSCCHVLQACMARLLFRNCKHERVAFYKSEQRGQSQERWVCLVRRAQRGGTSVDAHKGQRPADLGKGVGENQMLPGGERVRFVREGGRWGVLTNRMGQKVQRGQTGGQADVAEGKGRPAGRRDFSCCCRRLMCVSWSGPPRLGALTSCGRGSGQWECRPRGASTAAASRWRQTTARQVGGGQGAQGEQVSAGRLTCTVRMRVAHGLALVSETLLAGGKD